MRVLNLVTNDTARFFDQQVRALAAAGVESTTVPVPGAPRYYAEETTRSVLDYARFYPRVLRESLDGYDLVHANYGLTAPHALAQPTRPVVLSLWGSDLMGEYGWLTRRLARYADAVIVMSDEMAAELDVPAHVVPHGVDFETFAPIPTAAARERLEWDLDARHVLFPYHPDRAVKDFPRAERVVESARDRLDSPLELHAVTGLPHAEMPRYMNAADCLLLTSRREGSPNSVKEALACNLPVVSTDVGDVQQRLCDVTPSFVCRSDAELVDALAAVLARPERSDGREAARDVSLERMQARLLDIYRDVL